ncbi:MAG: hypothetical protein ACW981_13470 [Candidatus Hodarchaeales archaeon]
MLQSKNDFFEAKISISALEQLELQNFLVDKYFNYKDVNSLLQIQKQIEIPLNQTDRFLSLLAIYQLKLFIEKQIHVKEEIFNEIIRNYYFSSQITNSYDKVDNFRRILSKFNHIQSKIIHDLYFKGEKFFDFTNNYVLEFSNLLHQFVSTNFHLQCEKSPINMKNFSKGSVFVPSKLFSLMSM